MKVWSSVIPLVQTGPKNWLDYSCLLEKNRDFTQLLQKFENKL